MEEHLGYSKYDYENKNTSNNRNSESIKKHQTDVSHLESAVIGMYAKGIIARDIQPPNIYCKDTSPEFHRNCLFL